MRIRGDLLRISSGALNMKGEKLEPEEQVARREVVIEAPAKLGTGSAGTHVGSIPATIITEQSAGDQAVAMRSLCGNCKHFRNDLWLRDLKKADSVDAPIEKRRMVNKIRASIMQVQSVTLPAGTDGDPDVEQALHGLGYCMALFSFFKNMGKSNEEAMTIVMPESTCPTDVRSPSAPEGFFEFANLKAEQIANRNYDRVMNMAAGKVTP